MAGPELQLRGISGVTEGTVEAFAAKKKVTIGRTRANAFQIKHDTVSQRHAFVACKKGRWIVTDSQSSNGTFVNGVAVAPDAPVELKSGDVLRVGPDNEVVVKIAEPERDMEAQRAEGGLPVPSLTLREWFEHAKESLARESAAKAEATIRELEQQTDALKKKTCEAAGVEYSSISLKARNHLQGEVIPT